MVLRLISFMVVISSVLFFPAHFFAAEYEWPISFLPDTGQTGSHTDVPGEDSDYLINPLSYTDNNDNTVTDNVTGLMWQKDQSDHTILWNDTVKYCEGIDNGGYDDWRLPTSIELISIIDNSKARPSTHDGVFTGYFRAMKYWWSSTTQVYGNADRAWVVNGIGGIGNHPQTESAACVKCVRDHVNVPQKSDVRFTNKGETIEDSFTGLVWEAGKTAQGGAVFTWEQALKRCEELVFEGNDDWRLPNHKEIKTINNDSSGEGPTTYSVFKVPAPDNTRNHPAYWTSTTNIEPGDDKQAWIIAFNAGLTTHLDKTEKHYARCIRGGKEVDGTVR